MVRVGSAKAASSEICTLKRALHGGVTSGP
jgi:hypothetical protein